MSADEPDNVIKLKTRKLLEKIRELQGDPHFIARGMAIGVFVGITPTIPFHTLLAIFLAVVFRASKPAAYIGIWVSNPITIPFFYFACYKAGIFLFGRSVNESPGVTTLLSIADNPVPMMQKFEMFKTFFYHHADVVYKIFGGGLILGLAAAIPSYALTFRLVKVYSDARKKKGGQ